MKIALICTEKLPVPAVAGGAVQLYIEGILPYLCRKHDVTVYSIAHPGLPMREKINGVSYVRITTRSAADYVTQLKTAVDSGFDLIHVFNRPLWVTELAQSRPKTKFSLSLHNEMFHPEKVTDVEGLAIIQRVEFINTVSKFIAEGVAKRFPQAREKLNVVYSGADIQLFKTARSEEGQSNKRRLKEKLNLKGSQVVLFVGRLSVKKGVHILLKAMKKVVVTHPKAVLVIVGSKWYGENKTDDYSRSLERLAQELPGHIVFTGFLPPVEVAPYYNLGDVFVCPSLWNEPLARVHYEAMAAGLPIITTNRGGNPEVVLGLGNGRVINECENPDLFASCINYFLDNPEKAAAMGDTGRKLAEAKYNWERVAGDVLRAFDRVGGQKV